MFTAKTKVDIFQVVCALMIACSSFVFASEEKPSSDTTDVDRKKDEFRLADYWVWPVENVVQPLLNALIYPIAKPIDYVFTNGVVEKTVELITFGEKQNILIYPSFDFNPGSRALLGANYRHRNMFFDKDYSVFQMNYYANGDFSLAARYTKHAILGSSLFGGVRFDLNFDRDHVFILPETQISFTQPDTSVSVTARFGIPLNSSGTLNLEWQAALRYTNASLPDVKDSILVDDIFPIADRGLYQNSIRVPLEISVLFDNLDYPYAPSKGSRFRFTGVYSFVGDYTDLDESYATEVSSKNHDYLYTELLFQHYFFLGASKQFILSVKEARQNRKFYTDFSWDEAIRIWKPENVFNTLFERRVIATQFRMVSVWEMERGGAPFYAFVQLNSRTPLRGYGHPWTTHHMMSFSCEYRWPVDRFVDGVLFDEYALIAPAFNKWSRKQFYNSWGFGIRVRQPNMYLFRIQLGFHGLHGVNLVLTTSPEFK